MLKTTINKCVKKEPLVTPYQIVDNYKNKKDQHCLLGKYKQLYIWYETTPKKLVLNRKCKQLHTFYK